MGPALAAKFGKLGVKTVRDLLYYFPHRHLDYSKLKLISQLVEGEGFRAISQLILAQNIFLSISLRRSFCKRLY